MYVKNGDLSRIFALSTFSLLTDRRSLLLMHSFAAEMRTIGSLASSSCFIMTIESIGTNWIMFFRPTGGCLCWTYRGRHVPKVNFNLFEFVKTELLNIDPFQLEPWLQNFCFWCLRCVSKGEILLTSAPAPALSSNKKYTGHLFFSCGMCVMVSANRPSLAMSLTSTLSR